MVDEAALRSVFAYYARTLLGRYEVGDVLYALTDQMVEVLGIDGAGVSLRDDSRRLRFVAATDERVANIEETQTGIDEGPCYDAFRNGVIMAVDDLVEHTSWPVYRAVALTHGCRAVLGVPMRAESEPIGAVNLYFRRPYPWSADEVGTAQLLTDMAAGYVLNARSLSEKQTVAAQLRHALSSRVVIEQAKGVLAERHGIDVTVAFERLRRLARSRGERLHAVAQAVIDGTIDDGAEAVRRR